MESTGGTDKKISKSLSVDLEFPIVGYISVRGLCLSSRNAWLWKDRSWRKADLCLGRFFDLVDLTLMERVDRGRVPGNIDSRV
jgi:hypothetical protein